MLVKYWMSKQVFTIDAENSMHDAIARMKERKVRMLPVMENGNLVGVLSDTDLKRASASDATLLDVYELAYLLSRVKVRDLMSKKPVTARPDFTVEEAAELMMNNKISGLPVLDGTGALVGVITRHDLFKVLISLSGIGKAGILFGFVVKDQPGTIKELTDVIGAYNGRIASILSSYDRVPAGERVVFVRVYGIDRMRLSQLIETLGKTALLLFCVDHKKNKREIYHELEG